MPLPWRRPACSSLGVVLPSGMMGYASCQQSASLPASSAPCSCQGNHEVTKTAILGLIGIIHQPLTPKHTADLSRGIRAHRSEDIHRQGER